MPQNNPQVELLIWMLEDLRKVTLSGVEHLTKEQLFAPPIDGEYSIGAYLMHLAEVDLGWLNTLTGEEQPEAIKKRCYYSEWFDPDPSSTAGYGPPKEPLEVTEYFETIAGTRKMFIDYMSTLKDSELEETITLKRKSGDRDVSKKWILYHMIEHEAHTRGQMFMLIRKAGWNK